MTYDGFMKLVVRWIDTGEIHFHTQVMSIRFGRAGFLCPDMYFRPDDLVIRIESEYGVKYYPARMVEVY